MYMCPNTQQTADLVTFTEEILKGQLQFLRRQYFVNIEQWAHYFRRKIFIVLRRFREEIPKVSFLTAKSVEVGQKRGGA